VPSAAPLPGSLTTPPRPTSTSSLNWPRDFLPLYQQQSMSQQPQHQQQQQKKGAGNSSKLPLSLGKNQLFGTIPSSLGALTALVALVMYDNQLVGTIPSSLGALTALGFLALSTNQLSGTIPSSLGALTALIDLFLNDNQVVGTMPFCKSNQPFDNLVADCAKVNCICCTGCCPVAFGNIPVPQFGC
jgi:hypothetical protein